MTTYTAPSWLKPAAFEATLVPNIRAFASAYGGASQAQDLLGERWRYLLSLPPCSRDDAAVREALFAKLRGGAHRLRLPHYGRPLPRGTLRGAPTLGASAAQGTASLTLAGCTGTNLMAYGGMDIDAGPGVATGWVAYSAGSAGSVVRDTVVDATGRYQRIFATALGASSSDRAGVELVATIPVTAGQTYTLSADFQALHTGHYGALYFRFNDSGGTYLGEGVKYEALVGDATWRRTSVTATAPASAVTAQVYVWMERGAADGRALFVNNVQLAAGTETVWTPTTLKAGDMLGLADGQMVMVADDATATDAGTMTVTLANRLRAAVSSATAVTWNRPMADFMLMEPGGVPVRHELGVSAPIQVELMEVW